MKLIIEIEGHREVRSTYWSIRKQLQELDRNQPSVRDGNSHMYSMLIINIADPLTEGLNNDIGEMSKRGS